MLTVKKYFRSLGEALANTNVSFGFYTPDYGEWISLNDGIDLVVRRLEQDILIGGKKLIVVGNGGSAAIAIHTLTDYANAGGLRTVDLLSPAMLTCMANDYGYENVFSKPIEIFAEKGDALFAISSSGQSPNIIKAAETAGKKGLIVYTFSGFNHDNPLRKTGHLNFYVSSNSYGFVELAHQTLIHCILDIFLERKTKNNQ